MNLDHTQLATLAALLRNGSFEAAAQDLGVTQSAISQRLKTLEDNVGAQLVERGRPCTGTAIGLRLANHAEQIGLLEQTLSRDLTSLAHQPNARIRIAVNADSLATWLLDALAMCPGHLFDLAIDDQDYSVEWLRRGEVIGAVTGQAKPAPGCDVIALGTLEYTATASPAFIARCFPNGVTTAALSRAPVLVFNPKDRLQHLWMEEHVGPAPPAPSHGLPSSEGFVRACCLGLGWGMNPRSLVQPLLDNGTLVELITGATLGTPLYWQAPRLMRDALAPLTKALRVTARARLNSQA